MKRGKRSLFFTSNCRQSKGVALGQDVFGQVLSDWSIDRSAGIWGMLPLYLLPLWQWFYSRFVVYWRIFDYFWSPIWRLFRISGISKVAKSNKLLFLAPILRIPAAFLTFVGIFLNQIHISLFSYCSWLSVISYFAVNSLFGQVHF